MARLALIKLVLLVSTLSLVGCSSNENTVIQPGENATSSKLDNVDIGNSLNERIKK